MEHRFIPALFSIAQMRSEQLHPVAREALVRAYPWYLMGVFLPDIASEQEEQASFLRRWVLRYRDQERTWQKNLSDRNPNLRQLVNELMRSDSHVEELGEMASFALGAGVLSRAIWREEVENDAHSHLQLLSADLGIMEDDDSYAEKESFDWEVFWRPIWVMQDLLRFPRVIEHITKSCQSVFSTAMSGEALARWAKLLHLRLTDSLRKNTQSSLDEDQLGNDGNKEQLLLAGKHYVDLLNHLAAQYWNDDLSGMDRHVAAQKTLSEKASEPFSFDAWRTTVHAQRLDYSERGKNQKAAFYEKPPPYPGDSLPPLEDGEAGTDETQEFVPLASDPSVAAADMQVETMEGSAVNSETSTDPPQSDDTDQGDNGIPPTEEEPVLAVDEDTSEGDESSVDTPVSEEKTDVPEEKTP